MRTYLRKALALTISLLMLCTLIPLGAMTGVSAADALYHFDFEDGNVRFDGSGTRSIVQEGPDGSNCLHWSSVDGTWGWAQTFTYITVETNTEYTINFKMKSDKTTTVRVVYQNGAWTDGEGDIVYVEVKPTTSWADYSVTINSNNWTSALFKFQATNGANIVQDFWIDDIVISKKVDEPVVGGQAIFEKNFNDGELGFKYGSVVAEGPDGSNCLKWTPGGSWDATSIAVKPLENNTDYVFTFKAKASSAFSIFITIEDLSYYSNNYTQTTVNLTTEWKEYSVTMNTKTYCQGGGVYFKFQNNGGSGTVWADDIVISTVGTEPEPDEPDEPDEPSGENLIANGDFESGISGWTPQSSGTASATTTDPGAGNQSLKLDCSTANYNLVSVKVTVKPNTDYVLSFMTKVTSAGLIINFLSGGNLVNDYVGGQINVGGSSSWKSYSYEFNSASYSSFTLNFQSGWEKGTNSAIYLDNVVLIEKAALPDEPEEPTGTNLVVNGSFENGNEGWQIGADGSIVDGGYTGKAFQMSNPGAWKETGYQEIAVDAHAVYTLTWRSKRVSGTGTYHMEIARAPYDAVKPNVEGQTWMNDTSGNWIEHKVTITMTNAKNENDAISRIMIKLTSQQDSAGVILIDDIVLTKVPVASDDGYIKDGDFELNDWTVNWTNVNNACTATLVEGHDSSKALSIVATNQYTQVRQKMLNLKPNTDYVVTFWIKDAANMTLLLKTVTDDTNYGNQKGLSSGSDWKEVTYEFNSGSNESLWLGFMSVEGGNGTLIIDDIKVERKGGEIYPETMVKFGGTSVRDTEVTDGNTGYGLAFQFEIIASGAQKSHENKYVEKSAKILMGETNYKLVRMGAVLTNDSAVGKDADGFDLTDVTGKRTIEIKGEYLSVLTSDTVGFAVRVCDIPEGHTGTEIYARPYYVYEESNGTEVTVYGAIKSSNYAKEANPKSSIKILSIGHSFSKDVMVTNLYEMFEEGGYEDITIGYLYMAGCSMPKHLYNIQNNLAQYEYSKRSTTKTNGEWVSKYNFKAIDALLDEEWDYVTVQSSPDYIGGQEIKSFSLGKDNEGDKITLDTPMTEYEAMNEIVEWINANAEKTSVKVEYHMIWAFSQDCKLWSYVYHDWNQMTMYNNIISQTKKEVMTHSGIYSVIPSATALQNARGTFMGDTFSMPGGVDENGNAKDGYHLNDYGDYVAALTWYCHYSGDPASVINGYRGDLIGLNDRQFAAIAEAVDNAMDTWDAVTESSYKD